MDLEVYSVNINSDQLVFTYQFISEGPKGNILKLVQFTQIEGDFNNLAFGDYCPIRKMLDDKVVSDNGDRDKVLATVANCVRSYSRQFPERNIYATGSTPGRTRLYQMGIGKYRHDIENEFDIMGYAPQGWIPFETNINFQAFLLTRKFLNLEVNN